jgi:hypothetical protein
VKATIEITFPIPSEIYRGNDYDSYLANKTWFSMEESKRLIHNSMPSITRSIQLGYTSGKLMQPADDHIDRVYHGTWFLVVKSDEES